MIVEGNSRRLASRRFVRPSRSSMRDAAPDAEPIPPETPPDLDSPEREALESEPSTRCLNCGASLPGRFCPNCGQKEQPLRTPIHRFVVDTLAEYLGLDGRVWPTLGLLLFRPGRLTQAYIRGRRVAYVRPLRIYLTASVLFFLILELADPLGSIRGAVDGEATRPDSTVEAGVYLVYLDSLRTAGDAREEAQRDLVDSLVNRADALREAFMSDSLAGAFEEAPDSLDLRRRAIDDIQDDLEDERDDLEDMVGSTRDLRLDWRRALVATYPPDSLIRPYDAETAAELVVQGGETSGPELSGPEWMMGGESARRLRTARTRAERQDAAWALARDVIDKLPIVIFLLLPVFAFLMKLLYVRRGWFYAEHLVFALHVHAFAFSVYSVIAVLIWLSGGAEWAAIFTLPLTFVIPIYFVVAMKRVYAQGWIKTLFKVYLLSWMYSFVLLGGTVLAIMLAATIG